MAAVRPQRRPAVARLIAALAVSCVGGGLAQAQQPTPPSAPTLPEIVIPEPIPVPLQTLTLPPIVLLPPPAVVNLVPEDRALARALIETTNAFLDEVRTRATERRVVLVSPAAVRGLLAERLGRFGAKATFRSVLIGKLTNDLDRLGYMLSRKFTMRYWHGANEGPPPYARPCQAPLVTLPGETLRRCYDFVPPTDWAAVDDTPTDWLDLILGPGGDPAQGAMVEDMTIMDPNIYTRSRLILEDLQGSIGATDRVEGSVLLDGLAVIGNDRILAAQPDGSQWRLDPNMRVLIRDMTAYLEQAHQVWQAYERLIREDYTQLIADTYAQAFGLMQQYAAVEREALARLRSDYDALTLMQAKARFGATAQHALDPAAADAFKARHAAVMDEADALRSCVRSLVNVTAKGDMINLLATEWVRMPPGRPPRGFLFASPLALAPPPAGLDRSPDAAPAGCIFPSECSFIDPPGGITVAAAPTGLADMPAFGGFVLEPCRLVRVGPGTDPRQSAAPDQTEAERFVEVSAPETALP